MQKPTVYLWKQAPFIRLLGPLISGIVIEHNANLSFQCPVTASVICFTGLLVFNFRLSYYQFRFLWLNGVFIYTLVFCVGAILELHNNITHSPNWINNHYKENDYVIARIEEPLSEKAKSFKTIASVQVLKDGNLLSAVKGKIILYFQKDSVKHPPAYGCLIIFKKQLQPIRNSGNPGSFDYKQFAAFQDTYQQVYLNAAEYILLQSAHQLNFKTFLYDTREKITNILSTCISGKKECGLAEALLIGYKDNLDKTLVQSYSNTGVVHVIAISGLHLGLIYWLLTLLLQPIKKNPKIKWLLPILIIAGLWQFAMLAGGGASILRSAVMFTFIVIGNSLERTSTIYNSLAASAFLLLCVNPYWLWDVGFQLSYTAVLSIAIFMKPIYNCCQFDNKLLDAIWKLNAVTLAAQILTVPVTIFHFHQFPTYFLITNSIAVPLSSLIVLGEILLCAVIWIPVLPQMLGIVLHHLIFLMNSFIEHMERLPVSLWTGLQISFIQTIFLYIAITALSYWLLKRKKEAAVIYLLCMLCFIYHRSRSFIFARRQNKIVVYNMPSLQAIDFISGRRTFFKGDAITAEQDVYLKNSRSIFRVNRWDAVTALSPLPTHVILGGKKILIIDNNLEFNTAAKKIDIDIIIISHIRRINMQNLLKVFHCNVVIFDATIPARTVHKYATDCQELGQAYFSVVDNGAFVMNID